MFDNIENMEAFKQKVDFLGGHVTKIIKHGTDVDFLEFVLLNNKAAVSAFGAKIGILFSAKTFAIFDSRISLEVGITIEISFSNAKSNNSTMLLLLISIQVAISDNFLFPEVIKTLKSLQKIFAKDSAPKLFPIINMFFFIQCIVT